MKCVFCDTFETEDREELSRHTVRSHPEKTISAENYGQAVEKAFRHQVIAQVAAELTQIVCQNKLSVEEVITLFRKICQEIDEWV